MELLFISTPTHVAWGSHTSACYKVKKSTSGLWKTIRVQFWKQHCRVAYYTEVRESLRFHQEMEQKRELKVADLLLRGRLQSHSTDYGLLSMSNKALVNITLLLVMLLRAGTELLWSPQTCRQTWKCSSRWQSAHPTMLLWGSLPNANVPIKEATL